MNLMYSEILRLEKIIRIEGQLDLSREHKKRLYLCISWLFQLEEDIDTLLNEDIVVCEKSRLEMGQKLVSSTSPTKDDGEMYFYAIQLLRKEVTSCMERLTSKNNTINVQMDIKTSDVETSSKVIQAQVRPTDAFYDSTEVRRVEIRRVPGEDHGGTIYYYVIKGKVYRWVDSVVEVLEEDATWE